MHFISPFSKFIIKLTGRHHSLSSICHSDRRDEILNKQYNTEILPNGHLGLIEVLAACNNFTIKHKRALFYILFCSQATRRRPKLLYMPCDHYVCV